MKRAKIEPVLPPASREVWTRQRVGGDSIVAQFPVTPPMSESAGKAVFLSYASQDAEVAKRICEALRAAGIEVWFDQSELVGGDAWDAKIRGQVARCSLFVPIISANTQARLEGYFRLEWKLAANRTQTMAEERTFLLPLVIDATRDAEAKVPAEFRAVQWTRLANGNVTAALVQRVKQLASGEAFPVADGMAESGPISARPATSNRRGVPAAVWIGAVAIVVIGGAATWNAARKPSPPSEQAARRSAPSSAAIGASNIAEKSIAVLPFENLSGEKDSEHFSDGISDELLNQLGKVSGLRVVGRNSAFAFKGKNVAEAEIAQKLGVAYVVNGSVQQSGTHVRINARLTNAADGFQIWSEKFDEELKDIFSVQDRIAGLIAQNLQLKLGGGPRSARVVNPEAYRFLLEGRHFWNLRNEDGFSRADAAFAKALAIDPLFAEAHAGIAGMCAVRVAYRELDSIGETADDLRRGEAEARRAIELDASLAEAHAALGFVHLLTRNLGESERTFLRALELNPNSAIVHCWRGLLLGTQGRLDASIASYRQAAAIDPLWFVNLHLLGSALCFAEQYQEALSVLQRAAALRAQMWVPNRADTARCLLAVGRREEAVEMARQVLRNLDETPRWLGDATAVWVLRQGGLESEAAAFAKQLLERPLLPSESHVRGFVLCALGEFDAAPRYLVRTPSTAGRLIQWESYMDPFRHDPRFAEVLTRIGRTEEYRVARDTLARIQKERTAKK